MDKAEIEKELDMDYSHLLIYLKEKYGKIPNNYFRDKKCKYRCKKNSRIEEGLFIHHDGEYDEYNLGAVNLSDSSYAKRFDFKYQTPYYLTYCNYIEHLIIHVKINLLRSKKLGYYVEDGLMGFMIPDMNKLYRGRCCVNMWELKSFLPIKDNCEDYCKIISYWYKESKMTYNEDWKKL